MFVLAHVASGTSHLAELHSTARGVHGHDSALAYDVAAAGDWDGFGPEICSVFYGVSRRELRLDAITGTYLVSGIAGRRCGSGDPGTCSVRERLHQISLHSRPRRRSNGLDAHHRIYGSLDNIQRRTTARVVCGDSRVSGTGPPMGHTGSTDRRG